MKRFVTAAVTGFLFTVCLWATASSQPPVVFDFNDGTALDQAGIGASMVASNVTITTIEIIGQDGSRASEGVDHKTNIFGSWNALGINDANVSGDEYGSFDSGEAWIFSFDQDVYLSEIDLAGQGPGAELTIKSSTFSHIVLNYIDTANVHDLGNTFVAAGTEITFDMTSPTNAADTSLRVATLTVVPLPADYTANGTPYAWLDSYYTGLVTSVDYLNADTSDSDGDGMPAWMEYRAGTIPTNAASLLQVESLEIDSGSGSITWQSVTGKSYSVVSTSSLDHSATWMTVANNIAGKAVETTFTSTVVTAFTSFYRVGIEKREIYLLIGQSNMAGRGPIETEDEGPIDGCELFNFLGEWEPATNPLNQYSTIRKDLSIQQLNPGYGFAKRLHELRPDISLGLVVNARGGTSITEWAKGTAYYNAAVIRTQQALADGDCRLAGILWHQGESDSSMVGTYMDRLSTLIADLRADLNEPQLPFIAGLLEMDDSDGQPPRELNDVILQLPSAVTNTAVATTEGLTTLDGTHFDSASQRELGRRYADALLSVQ